MPSGGRRPGAGRKTTKPVETMIHRAREAAANAKITPLEYLISLLQDETKEQQLRFQAAVAAAPYVHPRLASIESNANVNVTTHDDAVREIEQAIAEAVGTGNGVAH